MKQLFLIWIIVLLSLVGVNSIAFSDGIEEETYPESMSKAEVTLRTEMRLVWERRAILQREHIISVIESSDDASAARDALITNAGELGAEIRPFYGYWAGWRLTGILKKDVLLTEKVIEAAKSGNERKLEAAKEKWYRNAHALARLFLFRVTRPWKSSQIYFINTRILPGDRSTPGFKRTRGRMRNISEKTENICLCSRMY